LDLARDVGGIAAASVAAEALEAEGLPVIRLAVEIDAVARERARAQRNGGAEVGEAGTRARLDVAARHRGGVRT